MLNNNQKTVLLNIVASPFFMALPIAFALIFLLPNPTTKYKIELQSKKNANKVESHIIYCDLDGDGYDERVVAFHNTIKHEAAIKVLSNDGINYDAWNFHGYFQKSSNNFYCTDIDNDGFKEVFVVYYRSDSVFLGAIKPYPNKEIIFKDKFISTVWYRDGKIDYCINSYTLADLNDDKNNELLFLLNAGYSRQPRQIIAYDFANETIIKSKSYGALLSTISIDDIDNDGLPEIYCGSSTPANIPDSMEIPYNDHYSWFFGFDNKLKLMFEPIKNSTYPSGTKVCSFTANDGKKYLFVGSYNTTNKTFTVKLLNSTNKIIHEKRFSNLRFNNSSALTIMKPINYKGKNYILLGLKNNGFVLLDENLEEKTIKSPGIETSSCFEFDLNKDSLSEYLFSTSDSRYIVYDNNFQNPVIIKTDIRPIDLSYFDVGVKHNGEKQDELYIKSKNYLRLYTYKPDNMYYLKYPMWFLVYLAVVLLLWFSRKLQKAQEKRKQIIEETINSLQMKTMKSQMDPHFMFNVLNGLANSVAKGNSGEAHKQILRFSQLLRSLMQKTERIDISLNEELKFVKSYLELEKFRFKDDFGFSVEMAEDVDKNMRLPRMLIQLLVENSIKHGLRNKEGIKKLNVTVCNKTNHVHITVEDNGVGRKQAMKTTRDTGKGTKLINEMIRLNRKLGGKEITVNYTDLYDKGGKALGTRVELEI